MRKAKRAALVVSVNSRLEILVPNSFWMVRPGQRVFFRIIGRTVQISRRPIGLTQGRFMVSVVRRGIFRASYQNRPRIRIEDVLAVDSSNASKRLAALDAAMPNMQSIPRRR